MNTSVDNIGARRLHTVLERIVEDISFDAPEKVRMQKSTLYPHVLIRCALGPCLIQTQAFLLHLLVSQMHMALYYTCSCHVMYTFVSTRRRYAAGFSAQSCTGCYALLLAQSCMGWYALFLHSYIGATAVRSTASGSSTGRTKFMASTNRHICNRFRVFS